MKFGDQIVDANGSFFKQVTIVKPDSLIAENIKKNVEIGGVTGTFAGDEVENCVERIYLAKHGHAPFAFTEGVDGNVES